MRLIYTFLAVMISISTCSQTYLDKIAEESCACAEKNTEKPGTDEFNMKLGLCMIDVSLPYQKQLKKDHKIDMNNIKNEGEKLGRLIGLRMAGKCPHVFTKMIGDDATEKVEIDDNIIVGEVSKIEIGDIVVFNVKVSEKEIKRIYWVNFVISEGNLIYNYKNFEGKKVKIKYEESEIFDPKQNDYVKILLAKEINLEER